MYSSVHFPCTLFSIKQKLEAGYKYVIDLETKIVRFKRVRTDSKDEDHVTDASGDSAGGHHWTLANPDCEDDIRDVASKVLEIILETGRGKDFVSVLKCISTGALPVENIALQLFLDIGQFLSVQTVNQLRYSQAGIDFWTVVRKLFKEKAINRFFRGFDGTRIRITKYVSPYLIS